MQNTARKKIDVKDVEEVLSLGNAVGANSCVLVALNGWTDPAKKKADAIGMDLRIFTLEQALDLMVPDKWIVCPGCENDCIVMDCVGGMVVDNMWSMLTAGRCRECHMAHVYCWDCGDRMLIKLNDQQKCNCGHNWKNTPKSIMVKSSVSGFWNEVSRDVPLIDPEAANTHITKGLKHRGDGNAAEAITEFTKAVDEMPISAVPYFHRAITYDQSNLITEAIMDYTSAIELDPDYAMAYGSRGIAHYSIDQLKEAIVDLERYLILQPDSPDRLTIENAVRQAKLKSAHQQR